MAHVVIVGGGAALAQPVIEHYLRNVNAVTAVCRRTLPKVRPNDWPGTRFQVVEGGPEDVGQGPFDVLIAMVGRTSDAKLTEMTVAQWDTAFHGNLHPVFMALRFLLPKMKDGGNVVVVGSIVGSTGGKGCANYAAAKAGLVGLVRAAANETAHRGICCNLLELGYVDAGMGARLPPKVKEAVLPTIPLGRFGTTEDVVQAVDYLGRVRYMTGGIMTLSGGLR